MAALAARRAQVGNLSVDSTVFFLCDMQELFRKKIAYFQDVLNVTKVMIEAANLLKIPIFATEHDPSTGCGKTVPEIDTSSFKDRLFTKTTFSMLGAPGLENELKKIQQVKSVVIFGVMADVCVYNTALELLERDYIVHVIADAVSSDHNCERIICLQRLAKSGAIVSTSKATLYNLIKGTDHPNNDAILSLLAGVVPDKGLMNAYGV
ncbi:isochorismatase domain-containing protein 2-like [Actinia tenebrosa]|uniref:Isochorismatase domain-containing protein 2-like n=1 Tax=Actinia tenebrosa TaxID=6105 RepID=A0A6P8ID43_ACTTE|nr:isochorismatase domain-containing protein 2-like [Actinia tenebrosa]